MSNRLYRTRILHLDTPMKRDVTPKRTNYTHYAQGDKNDLDRVEMFHIRKDTRQKKEYCKLRARVTVYIWADKKVDVNILRLVSFES